MKTIDTKSLNSLNTVNGSHSGYSGDSIANVNTNMLVLISARTLFDIFCCSVSGPRFVQDRLPPIAPPANVHGIGVDEGPRPLERPQPRPGHLNRMVSTQSLFT